MIYLELAGGLILLLAAGELLVRGAVSVASCLGVSPLFIGLTLIGFGTSTPELMASLFAALEGAPGIAVGNVIGSNISNILLILGVSALIRRLPVSLQPYHRDSVMLLLSSLLLSAACVIGSVGRVTGLGLLAALVLYIAYTYQTERTERDASAAMHEAEADSRQRIHGSLWRGLLVTAVSLAGVMAGAALLVDGAIGVAGVFGVSETVIGLTVVAVGTSMPELVVSALAAWRGQGAVAVGNIVGSNIYNSLFIIGATALVKPIDIPAEVVDADLWVMNASMAAVIGFMATGVAVSRPAGFLFVLAYAIYVVSLVAVPAAG